MRKLFSSVLLCGGLFVMLHAVFFMDISVEGGRFGGRVANLHLMNERTTLVLFGGILFLAGVVFLAASGFASRSSRTHDASQRAATNLAKARATPFFTSKKVAGIAAAVMTGTLGAALTTIYFAGLSMWYFLPLMALPVVYARRDAPALKVVKHLHILNLVGFGLLVLLFTLAIIFFIASDLAPAEGSATRIVVAGVLTFLCGVPALVTLATLRREHRPETET